MSDPVLPGEGPMTDEDLSPSGCGTAAGYHWHRKHGQEVCESCRDAWRSRCKEYRRRRKEGVSTARPSAEERFWAYVEKTETCWVWKGGLSATGYGQFHYEGRNWRVHRYSYTLLVGPITDGLVLDHLCRNRACVNPDHLEAVSNRTNIVRGQTLPAENVAKTHCARQHPYDEENTWVNSKGHRYCRKCHAENQRNYTQRKAAQDAE